MRALVAGGWFEKEKHIAPAAGKQPHITFILLECVPPSPRAAFRGGGWGLLGPSGVADSPRCSDYGWADAGWHRIDDRDPSKDVMTPNMNQLVKEGIEMDRQCESASGALLSVPRCAPTAWSAWWWLADVYKYCSPTRTAIQSGRNPYHVVSACGNGGARSASSFVADTL